MAPRVPAEILENIRPGSAYGNNGGYGCLLMETVKDRPYGAIFDQAIHITIGIYTILADILNIGTLNIWLPLTKSIFFRGFVLNQTSLKIKHSI